MRLVKVDASKIGTYTATKLDVVVDEFIAMNEDVVEIQAWDDQYKTVYSCVSSMNIALKRRKENGVKCIVRRGVPYIVKREVL